MKALLRPLAVLVLGASSLSAEETWTPLGRSGGGAMFGPAISPVDPQRMIVHCDMSGAYRSEDGGRSWTLIHADQLQGHTRCRPAFHPTDRNVIYSPTGGGARLKVSRDGGRTWAFLGGIGGEPRGEIAVDPDQPERLLVGVDESAALSRDGGRTWARCAGVRGAVVGFYFDRAPSPSNRALFAATPEGVFRSDDDGVTWAEKNHGLPSRGLRGFTGGSRTGRTWLYCTVPCRLEGGALTGGIYASTDRGEHWKPVMNEGLNRDTRAYDAWAMGSVVQYHQVLTTDADPLRVYAFNANTAVAVPHHTAVYRTDNGGQTWRPTFFPDPRWPGYNGEPNHATVCEGQYFQSIPYGVAICASQPDVLMQLNDGDCVITTNGGARWFNGDCALAGPAPDGPAKKIRDAAFRNTGLVVTTTWNYYLDPFEPRRHYLCYTDIGFARSLDAGATWHSWGDGARAPWRNTCYELVFDPAQPGRLWGAFSNIHDIPNENIISGRHNAVGPGGICVSEDFGVSWKVSSQGLPVAPALSVVVDPKSPAGSRTLYAGIFGHGVFKSVDDGRSWQPKNEGLGAADNRRVVRVARHADGTIFALVTALRISGKFSDRGPGLYRSRNGGDQWEKLGGGGLPLLKWPKDFAVNPADSRHILIAAADAGDRSGGLYGTSDGGSSWTLMARKGPQHFSAAFSPHHRGWIYMTLTEGAPESGLWLSKDSGSTWVPFASLPHRNAQRVAFDPADPKVIYVTTFGASALRGPAEP